MNTSTLPLLFQYNSLHKCVFEHGTISSSTSFNYNHYKYTAPDTKNIVPMLLA